MQHTPGPWLLEIRETSVVVTIGLDVVQWRLYGGEDADMDAETIANARLISEAPTILDRLKSIREAVMDARMFAIGAEIHRRLGDEVALVDAVIARVESRNA